MVEGSVIVEFKTVQGLERVFFSIVRSYMKAAGFKAAMMLNFGDMTLEIKRVYLE